MEKKEDETEDEGVTYADDKDIINKLSMVSGMKQEEIKEILGPMDKIYAHALKSLKVLTEIIDNNTDDTDKKMNFLVSYFVLSLNLLGDEKIKRLILKTMEKSEDNDEGYAEFMEKMRKL